MQLKQWNLNTYFPIENIHVPTGILIVERKYVYISKISDLTHGFDLSCNIQTKAKLAKQIPKFQKFFFLQVQQLSNRLLWSNLNATVDGVKAFIYGIRLPNSSKNSPKNA